MTRGRHYYLRGDGTMLAFYWHADQYPEGVHRVHRVGEFLARPDEAAFCKWATTRFPSIGSVAPRPQLEEQLLVVMDTEWSYCYDFEAFRRSRFPEQLPVRVYWYKELWFRGDSAQFLNWTSECYRSRVHGGDPPRRFYHRAGAPFCVYTTQLGVQETGDCASLFPYDRRILKESR